ncbi:unknown [Prevotella sp. CAG:873]|nr:unknown [Prevotella sp. CAG:873]
MCGHFLDLRMGQGLNAEVVIFLKLVLHEVVAAVNLRDNVLIHYLIARQLQKVNSADCIVALVFGRFKTLSYLFGKFVVHKSVSDLVFTKLLIQS